MYLLGFLLHISISYILFCIYSLTVYDVRHYFKVFYAIFELTVFKDLYYLIDRINYMYLFFIHPKFPYG